MPSPQQERLMELLVAESGPITASELAKKAGLTTESTSTQLSRLSAKEGMALKDDQGEWTLTDAGREYVARPTEETAGTSEYEIFMSLGRRIGVTGDLIRVVAEHVWSGGDYEDVNWVWKALGEMDIRSDQRKRWCNAWRSHLGKAIPPELREEMAKVSAKGEQEEEGVTRKEGRDYIIIDDVPIFAGEGAGDMSLKDAKDVISMRALRARVAAGQGGGSPQAFSIKEVMDLVDKVNAGHGNASQPSKSYVVTQTPEGTRVEELEEGKPIVVGTTNPTPPTGWVVDQAGNLSEVKQGQPIVVKQAAEPPPTYLVQDGVLKKVEPGQPIVIQVKEPGSNLPTMPIQLSDKDGNPMVMDMNALINWKRFEGDEKRADEKTEQIKKLVEFFRSEGPKAIEALKIYAAGVGMGGTTLQGGGTSEPQGAFTSETPTGFEGTCPSCQQPISLSEIPTGEFPCPHCGVTLTPPE